MSVANSWLAKAKTERQEALVRLASGQDSLPEVDYMRLVDAGQNGVYASIGANFMYAVFGRDSIEVAEDLMATHKQMVERVIFTLARLQGTKTEVISEEEPGKIHHEYRSLVMNGQTIPEGAVRVMDRLQRWWGGQGTDTLLYYGSYDATPLYIRLVGRYVQQYGDAILGEIFINKDQEKLTIRESVERATQWLVGKIEASPWQLLEFKRLNPSGIPTQVWKDSATSYLHSDGAIANVDGGVASIELQGYAYDALVAAASLLPGKPELAEYYQSLAAQLQQRIVELFWMSGSQFFAQGLDRDGSGQRRQIATLTTNAGLLLESRLLSDLPVAQAAPLAESVVRQLYSQQFLTEAGVRSRALQHMSLLHFVDYHGSYAVWPKETYDIAKGFRNFGYHHLADQLENRIIRSIQLAGEFCELFYVESDGEVWYDQEAALRHFGDKSHGVGVQMSESGQAWTISAVQAALWQRSQRSEELPMGELEAELLSDMPAYSPLISAQALV